MNYQHILVAIDLSDSSEYIINKAVSLAKVSKANISIIYVDIDYANNYTGLSYSEFTMLETGSQRSTELKEKLQQLVTKTDYPITNAIFESGDLNKTIQKTAEELGADLLVCGHHHDFWGSLLSASRKLVNRSAIDIFIVQI